MSDKTIKIIVGGKEDAIDVLDFVKIVRNTVAVLDAINSEPEWLVGSVSRSSPLAMELLSNSDESAEAIGVFIEGLRALETEPRRPPGFNTVALTRAKRLVQPLGNGISELHFIAHGRPPLRASLRIAASVDALTHSPSYELYTEFEGTLGEIFVHGGRAEICIFDPITDKSTTCRFNSEDAESVGALITHRIRVFGKARYSRKHKPEAIKVERWEGPIGEDAPSLRDLHDAGFRITSDESSQEIIRKLRDLDG